VRKDPKLTSIMSKKLKTRQKRIFAAHNTIS
jgi:hypothetical protein